MQGLLMSQHEPREAWTGLRAVCLASTAPDAAVCVLGEAAIKEAEPTDGE
jgi:hypothetical protein